MNLYVIAKGLFRLQFRIMGWKVHGLEKFPNEGPVIVIANHMSLWDPLIAGCSIPRKVSFMAKEELFSNPLFSSIIRQLGAFPVKRGRNDTSAIRNALGILKEGHVLGLFPEGTRSKNDEIQKGLPGMVLLMEKSHAPIVPVKVMGTKNLITKGWGKIEVIIGDPITPESLAIPKEINNRREWMADRIMELLRSLEA